MVALPACSDTDRFTHEPRALWTVQRIRAAASAATLNTAKVVVPGEHFRNHGPYPITLTKLLVMGVNYAFRDFQPATPLTAQTIDQVHASASAVNFATIWISAPFSRYYTKRPFRLTAQPALPVAEPGMRYSPTPYSGGPFGLTRWTFDRLLHLPRKSTIQFDITGWNVPILNSLSADENAYSTVFIDEVSTGRFGGNSRVRPRAVVPALRNQDLTGAAGTFFPRVTNPLPEDFGFPSLNGNTNDTFPASGVFTSREFNKQETNRGQPMSHYAGFAVQLDQIAYEEAVQDEGAPVAGQPLSPLSMKVGCRAKVSNGGTNMAWWRDCAPVALVCPTITPAQVYDLVTPIQLGPGEQLDIELEVPVGPTVNVGTAPTQARPYYNIGVSMTGYATIE